MERRVLAVTGRPGIGKTTLVLGVAQRAASLGCRVGGVVTPEVRTAGGQRWGFKLRDLLSGSEHVLASIDSSGPRVGRYRLDPGAEGFLVNAINSARSSSDLMVIDEIGPMELSMRGFRDLVRDLLSDPPVPMAVTFHYRLKDADPEVYRLVTRGMVIELTEFNRGTFRSRVEELTRWLIDEACGGEGRQGAALRA